MKLDSLRQAGRNRQVRTVVALVGILAVTVIAGFGVGLLTDQPDQERPQQTNKLIIDKGTADVTENATVDTVALTVRRGTTDVNLSTTTIEWLGPNSAQSLVFADETSDTVSPGDGRQFSVIASRDEDKSSPVVNDDTDRFRLVINVTAVSGQQLVPGETVDVKLITAPGAVTRYTITIPESLDDQTTVNV